MKEETETVDQIQLPPFFYEIFDASLPRLGPGDAASTRRALKTLLALRPANADAPRILDVGCGNGAPTLQLARHTNGTVIAVDNHEPFLRELQRRAAAEGLSDRIQTRLRDMNTLGADMGHFDIIWSESALFVMGFREGLAACYERLVPGGFLAASEMCWLRADAPANCLDYFAEVYPAIAAIDAHLAAIRSCGYEVVEHFTLPESAWWDGYYTPLEARLKTLRQKHVGDSEKAEMLDAIQAEIDLYRTYSSYYGYAFYLMRRP